ncbi:MAG: hypothetical protein IT160_14410 [Bryobacterales bacterium]|nr:hypothetical protein [Bryobacterales bacterium]
MSTRGFTVVLFALASCAFAQAPVPGTGLASTLFRLHEMDLHLHSGMERQVSLDKWLDLAAADGRKVVVLLDHLELYRRTPAEYQAWLDKRKDVAARYPLGQAGHEALWADFERMRQRKHMVVFTGWEVSELELDEGTEPDSLLRVDMVGFHISPNNKGNAPDGPHLIRRALQVKELQKKVPRPMVLFHPFTMRVEKVQKRARLAGKSIDQIPVSDYRFFHGDEQKRLADILRGTSIYVEIGRATGACMQQPNCRQAMIEDVKPLADMGVQFTVSTDAHSVASLERTFRPETFCEPLGVTEANVNTLVRELLAYRARIATR